MFSPKMFQCLCDLKGFSKSSGDRLILSSSHKGRTSATIDRKFFFSFLRRLRIKKFIAFVSHTSLDERKQDLKYNQMWVNKDAILMANIISLVALNALKFTFHGPQF